MFNVEVVEQADSKVLPRHGEHQAHADRTASKCARRLARGAVAVVWLASAPAGLKTPMAFEHCSRIGVGPAAVVLVSIWVTIAGT